jgi:NAD(P)-dependent dehydrogenase (short-subunit alcohol dehydrogenase family)
VKCDVTDEESINAMVQRATEEFGRVDILVNNAGIMAPAPLVEMPLKRWDLIWRVNVRGAIACSKAVLPGMIEQRDGVIFNISSIAADQESAGNISYMLTKHALRELARGLAAEVREHNVRVSLRRTAGCRHRHAVLPPRRDDAGGRADARAAGGDGSGSDYPAATGKGPRACSRHLRDA